MLNQCLLNEKRAFVAKCLGILHKVLYQHLGQVSTLKDHLFCSDAHVQNPTVIWQRYLWYHTKVLTILCFSVQSVHSNLQRRSGNQQSRLLALQIKALGDKNRKSRAEITSVGKQNCNERVGQRTKQLGGSSPCSFRSAGCQNYLRSCWCLDFCLTDLELCSLTSFPKNHPVTTNGVNVHIFAWITVANNSWAFFSSTTNVVLKRGAKGMVEDL